jgi:hypothetical protein
MSKFAFAWKVSGIFVTIATLLFQIASAQESKVDLERRLASASETLSEIMAEPDKVILPSECVSLNRPGLGEV